MITPSVRSELAPTGKLRVGINYGNPVLASRDAAGKMFDAVKTGAWDLAFLAVDPGRANEVDFTAPYVEIEGTYLVPSGAPFRTVDDVDRDGVRVGVSGKSAYDLFLSRHLKHAQIVRASSPEGSLDLILSGKVDVLAGVRQTLELNAAKVPGSRVFADRFMAIGQALGIVKGRAEGAKYVRAFIEDVKASGFVAQALKRAGVSGVSVAPPATD